MTKLDQLITLVNRGWKILPLHWVDNGRCSCKNDECAYPGKHPILEGGYKVAVDIPEKIEVWHEKYPQANWGVRCGPKSKGGSGFFCLDIDPRNGGLESWQTLLKKHLKAINTVEVSTGGEQPGIHLYFLQPDTLDLKTSKGRLGPGIDILSTNSYAIIPPSVTVGPYLFHTHPSEVEIADAPSWILDKVNNTSFIPPVISISSVIPCGMRNDTLFREACALRDRGYEEDEIFSAIWKLNTNRCELDSNGGILDDKEVTTLVKSAMRYSPTREIAKAKISLNFISADELLNKEWPEPSWAIPGVVPEGLTIFAGKPKVGKSWLALQFAQAIAEGGSIFGEEVQPGCVLYLALEDPPRRLSARMKTQSWKPKSPVDFLVMGQFESQVGNLQKGGGEVLANMIGDKGYRLLVVDTLGRSVYGDKNDYEAMINALSPIHQMAHDANCAVVLIDHHSKGRFDTPDAILDILGSTAKGGTVDTAIGLYRGRGKATASLQVIGRDVEEKSLEVTFNSSMGLWVCDRRDSNKLTPLSEKIISVIKEIGPCTNQEIADAIGKNKGQVFKELQELDRIETIKRDDNNNRVMYSIRDQKKV